MTMQDPLSDMLTRIRNAQTANIETVDMPYSGTKLGIAEVLKKEGYISDAKVEGDGAKKSLNLTLRYAEGDSAIEMIERVSRPGRRVYCNVDDMPRVRGGLGVVMVSTS